MKNLNARLKSKIIHLYFISLYLGNIVYFFQSFLTPMNILLGCMLIILLFELLLVNKVKLFEFMFVFGLFVMLLFGTIHGIYSENIEGLQKVFYLVHFFTILCLSILYKYNSEMKLDFFWVVFVGLSICFMLSFLQFIASAAGGGHLDFLIQNKIRESIVLITGGFGNPNNLAFVAVGSFFICLLWWLNGSKIISKFNNKHFIISIFMVFFICIMTMSRAITAVFLGMLLLTALRKKKYFIILGTIISLFPLFAFINYFSDSSEILQRNYTKFLSILSFEGNSSSTLRFDLYSHIILKGLDFPLGLGFSNYDAALSGLNGYEPFLATTPHSFIFEIYLAFGFLGWLFLFSFACYLMNVVLKNRIKGGGGFLFALLIISFIPGTIMKMPVAYFIFSFPIFINYTQRPTERLT